MNGKPRKTAVKSTKQRLKELETTVQNMGMAMQMSQMMVKHLTNQLSALQQEVGGVMGMSNDFQYRTLAMLEVGNFDKDAIDAKADELKLNDFNKASLEENLVKGYVDDETGVVTEDSIVVISSSTPDLEDDKGVFRSKFTMAECNTPDLREGLLKTKVGGTFNVTLNDIRHAVTLHEVLKVIKAETEEDTQEG